MTVLQSCATARKYFADPEQQERRQLALTFHLVQKRSCSKRKWRFAFDLSDYWTDSSINIFLFIKLWLKYLWGNVFSSRIKRGCSSPQDLSPVSSLSLSLHKLCLFSTYKNHLIEPSVSFTCVRAFFFKCYTSIPFTWFSPLLLT